MLKEKGLLLEEGDTKPHAACHVPDANQQVSATTSKRERRVGML
jgi:hypothetical protein